MAIYLLPNLLHETADPAKCFPPHLNDLIYEMDGFFVETPKQARKYLKLFDFDRLRDKPMEVVNKRTSEFDELLGPVIAGEKWGMVTDAGLPCLADPGARLVLEAQRRELPVEAVVGPSSIVLALQLSGLDSQNFYFGGYLPRKLDRGIRRLDMTQLFIETPYNGERSFEKLLEVLGPRDFLSVAIDLTAPTQEVHTHTVREWQKGEYPSLSKRPAIFLIRSR